MVVICIWCCVREQVREWITQSACVRACHVWLLRDRMHVCVSEGCPLLLVTKRPHRTARTEVFPDTWQLLVSLPGYWPKHFVIEGKDEGSRRARKSFTESIHHTLLSVFRCYCHCCLLLNWRQSAGAVSEDSNHGSLVSEYTNQGSFRVELRCLTRTSTRY